MTSIQEFSGVLHTALGGAFLVFLLFKFWRESRVAALREKLFAIREELFDYAADGHIPFDHPAYARLRMLMNSMIRFAHCFTGLRLFVGGLFFRILGFPNPDFLEEWTEALSTLPAESQKKLKQLHDRSVVAIVKHIVVGSPVLFPLVLILLPVWAVLKAAARWIVQGFPPFSILPIRIPNLEVFAHRLPGVEMLESQVIQEDIAERKQRELEEALT